MPLLPTAGPPMPGMPTMPGPSVQPSPMMDAGMPPDPGMGGPMPPDAGIGPAGLGGMAPPSSPTQSIIMALLANQTKSDATNAQIMGEGAAEAQASAQQGASALQALIQSMMTQPNPLAQGAVTEPVPAMGTGLPPAGPSQAPGGAY